MKKRLSFFPQNLNSPPGSHPTEATQTRGKASAVASNQQAASSSQQPLPAQKQQPPGTSSGVQVPPLPAQLNPTQTAQLQQHLNSSSFNSNIQQLQQLIQLQQLQQSQEAEKKNIPQFPSAVRHLQGENLARTIQEVQKQVQSDLQSAWTALHMSQMSQGGGGGQVGQGQVGQQQQQASGGVTGAGVAGASGSQQQVQAGGGVLPVGLQQAAGLQNQNQNINQNINSQNVNVNGGIMQHLKEQLGGQGGGQQEDFDELNSPAPHYLDLNPFSKMPDDDLGKIWLLMVIFMHFN
jgi:hypothetical protein